jgi:hypothetical protein
LLKACISFCKSHSVRFKPLWDSVNCSVDVLLVWSKQVNWGCFDLLVVLLWRMNAW